MESEASRPRWGRIGVGVILIVVGLAAFLVGDGMAPFLVGLGRLPGELAVAALLAGILLVAKELSQNPPAAPEHPALRLLWMIATPSRPHSFWYWGSYIVGVIFGALWLLATLFPGLRPVP